MRSSENQCSLSDHSYPQYNPSPSASSKRPLTPDPSPSMNPENPKNGGVKVSSPDIVGTANSPRQPAEKEKSLSSVHPGGTFVTSSGLSKGINSTSTSCFIPSPSSSSPNSTRPIHSLYPNATPPMSPAHSLLSPASNSHHNSTDHSQHVSGFYQLPPPLQSFKPHDTIRQSPSMSPLQSQQFNQSGGPLPRSSHMAGYSGMSPRSNPQLSPHIHHSVSSPSIGPLSPYPTPQSHPQHHSSPHQSPRYESHQHKHSIPPSMSLPASSFSSTSVFQVLPPRPYPAPQPNNHSANNSTPHGSQLKSPRSNVSQRSAPNSPQRFMMLPPQTAPTMALAHQSSSQSKSSSSAATKNRASSGTKAVDQETREMMRKVSHSAIERRRRERINDKILQLKHLVPACIDEDHLHKLSILQSTIEYIQYLKSVIPESVANAKFEKATNSNPNNKTTDMLEALSGTNSTMSFAPMMTTGLGQPYSKRIKSDQPSSRRRDTLVNSESAIQSNGIKRSSATQSSSDEDAKDGLLLLSRLSSGTHLTNTSPSLAPEREMRSQASAEGENSIDAQEYRRNKGGKDDDNDEDEDEGPFQNSSEESGDSEDGEYQDDEVMEASEMDGMLPKEGVSSGSSNKMSVEQMLC